MNQLLSSLVLVHSERFHPELSAGGSGQHPGMMLSQNPPPASPPLQTNLLVVLLFASVLWLAVLDVGAFVVSPVEGFVGV